MDWCLLLETANLNQEGPGNIGLSHCSPDSGHLTVQRLCPTEYRKHTHDKIIDLLIATPKPGRYKSPHELSF